MDCAPSGLIAVSGGGRVLRSSLVGTEGLNGGAVGSGLRRGVAARRLAGRAGERPRRRRAEPAASRLGARRARQTPRTRRRAALGGVATPPRVRPRDPQTGRRHTPARGAVHRGPHRRARRLRSPRRRHRSPAALEFRVPPGTGRQGCLARARRRATTAARGSCAPTSRTASRKSRAGRFWSVCAPTSRTATCAS